MDSYIPVIVGADHPARFIEGTSINDAGQVVGIHAASSTADHTAGFRFDPGSGLHELGNISASEKGLAPLSINSAGDIVGMAGDYDDPFLYKASASGPKSVRHFFKDAGFKQSFVVEINDAGQILGGGFSKEANRYRSLVLTKDHEIIQFIPGFDDYSTWPTAINNGGLVIGEKQEHGFYAGYAYDLGSKESHLFLPKSYDRDVKVLALNDQGEVLFLDRSAGVFLYKNGVTTELFPMGSGADHPVALDVHQHILSDTATLYDRDNPSDGWVDLNDVTVNLAPGWHIERGVAINNKRQILCTAVLDIGSDEPLTRPVILTPGVWVEGPSFKAPDLSRLKAIMRILFGIVEDAPGLAISGKRPHWVGPGPGDPGPGPLREALARLGSSEQRDTLLGLSLAEIGTLLGNSALAREVGALAARVVARASGRSAAPASAQRDRGANRLGGRNALLQRVFAASRRNTRT